MIVNTIINMQNSIYLKSFIFEANYYEEYSNGKCIIHGPVNIQIAAKVLNSECLAIHIESDTSLNLNSSFGLPILGINRGDILHDRVQYGRLPDSFNWEDPNEPLVLEIFNNLRTLRFAMLSPLRIIEFTGKFVDIK